MMFFLYATPCKGGFYGGMNTGVVFSQFSKCTQRAETLGGSHASINLFSGYGLVSGGKYVGMRAKILGLDFAHPGEVFKTHIFWNLEAVIGLYLTPSNLFYVAPGVEISSNSHKDNEHQWKWDWGTVVNVGSRTMITEHWFWQLEGTILFHPNVLDRSSSKYHKQALRFYMGIGYNH